MNKPLTPAISPPQRPDLRKFAQFLDAAVEIPGLGISVGFDGLIGIIPGFGDGVATLLSTYIVFEAAKEGVSTFVLLRMLLNIAIASVIGIIPFFGDAIDILWRANLRNVALLERSRRVVPAHASNRKRVFVLLALFCAFILLVTVIAGIAGAWVLWRIVRS